MARISPRLRRTAIGTLDVADAVAPDGSWPRSRWTAPWRTCRAWTSSAEEAIAAGHGRVLGPAGIAGPYAVFAPDGTLIGVYEDDGTKARPQVILAARG